MAKVAAEGGSTANRYQILAKLAVGGMAEIFLARGASVAGVERYCVLKRILRDRAGDAQFVQMFLDEAKLAAQLQHPNIASVYDIGMLGDSYFFTMEYVHGETVRSLIERAHDLKRPLPLACVLTIITGTAAGLHHAHTRNANDGRPLGIVHRDVSPSNIMVSFEGSVKLVDFGVAKAADRANETRSGTVKGKISYLSPEQCRGVRVDRRSDMFSLGIVMWEMLTGARLYRRASDFDNMRAIVDEPPRPPSALRPDVPRPIDDIVLRLLAKDPGARYQTADEVVEAVEHASMRAATLLSTSALSRLVRDLFGARAEPWLELGLDTMPHDVSTLMSRPVPGDLGLEPREPLDPFEAELAGVRDLSSSNVSSGETQELDSAADLLMDPDEPVNTDADASLQMPAVRPSVPLPGVAPAPGSAHARPSSRPSTPIPVMAPPPSGRAAPAAIPTTPSPSTHGPRISQEAVPAVAPTPPSGRHARPASAPIRVTPVPDELAAPSAAPGATTIRFTRDHLPGVAPLSGGAPARASAPSEITDPNAAGASSASTLRMSERPAAGAPARDSGPIAVPLEGADPNVMAATIRTSPASFGRAGTASPEPRAPTDPGSAMAAAARLSPAALAGAPSTADLLAGFDPAKKPGANSTLLGVVPPSAGSGGYAAVFATPSQLPVQVSPSAAGQRFGGPAAPPELATSSDMVALASYPASRPPVDAPAPAPTASGISWSFVTMIVVAIVVGVVAVWWVMRLPANPRPSEAPGGVPQGAPKVSSDPPAPLDAPPPLDAPAASDAPEPPGATAAPVTGASPPGADPGSGAGSEIDFSPEPTQQRPQPQPPVEPKPAPHAEPKPAPHADPKPAPHAEPKPPAHTESPHGSGSTATPARPAASPAGSKIPPSLAELNALWHQGDSAGVVRSCSSTTMTAEIAIVCVLSACQEHSATNARRWLSSIAKARQDMLAARCKDIGNIDIGGE